MSKAELDFSAAFERLKSGNALILPPGSSVSQNNVAKEAGKDPSALRKSRYPKLIADIQAWIASDASTKTGASTNTGAFTKTSTPTKVVIAKAKDPYLESQLADAMLQLDSLREERDLLLSKLLMANERILLLTSKIKEDDNAGKGSAPIVFT